MMEPIHPETLCWAEDRRAVEILDQTLLPEEERYVRIESADAMVDAIRQLRVRGAPAIGVAAAMALALEAALEAGSEAARERQRGAAGAAVTPGAPGAFRSRVQEAAARLVEARPTAVNLRWAVERLQGVLAALPADMAPGDVACRLWGEADAIRAEDRAMCRRIGEHGLALLGGAEAGAQGEAEPLTLLTHCNAGALATAGMGTALAPVYLAHAAGRRVRVFADETRPLLQGSRITAWELSRAGIDVTVLADNAAAALLRRERVDAVLVGADRIAANGDVANKIGTYGLAVLARRHGVPFYVLAPTSTVDPFTPNGDGIEIEERAAAEVNRGFGRLTAPADVPVFAPAFDVTPAELVDAIVTDRGVFRPPYAFR